MMPKMTATSIMIALFSFLLLLVSVDTASAFFLPIVGKHHLKLSGGFVAAGPVLPLLEPIIWQRQHWPYTTVVNI